MKFREEIRALEGFLEKHPPKVEEAPGAELQLEPVVELGDYALRLSMDSKREMWTPAFESADPASKDMVVFGLPGMLRNSKEYFQTYWDCIVQAEKADTTKLIVPNIVTEADVLTDEFKALALSDSRYLQGGALNIPYFGVTKWKNGDFAHNLSQGQDMLPGSYDLWDAFLQYAVENDYEHVCVITNSASGQAGERAWMTRQVETFAALRERNVSAHTVISGASSHLWLNAHRPYAYDPADRSTVNQWRYGLEHMPSSIKITKEDMIRELQEGRRPIVILAGENDRASNQASLTGTEHGAAAMAQGLDRRERHWYYYRHLAHEMGAKAVRFGVVPNATHAARDIYSSELGQLAIFNPRELPRFSPAQT